MNTYLPIILGSTSIFRRQQLETLGLYFEIAKPECDETPLSGETPETTALRLAKNKAYSLAGKFPKALIIGADQVAYCNGRQLGKPMSVAKAQQMLKELSGQHIDFYSALCLLNTATGKLHSYVDHTTVTMRVLSSEQISRYLEREPDAIYCAGAAKSEGLGAALLSRIETTDPNALIGLPLFRLVDFLNTEGIYIV
ncbi:septum formation inhibitor Maf [Neisseria arctica]|uniref:7-methyl-GTP pyrophosphatase n=1 Tax=Neisseria arctica TaxID=1470200 RepID=A0A0J0YRF0_9NEIS|nr:nucleoside triphosphate pyrophosphatase [Neisseria arctica]KLT72702.1 septum formation inhibitor Maf [Neisseria arctica]UOO87189.1 Maf family nucleotide pyrophosphatase [Neisseria arctica]